MNKKLSRIAAIALSAAMVTSAFAMSTSSAFAAAKVTVTPTVSATATDVAAVAGTDQVLDLSATGVKYTLKVGDKTEDLTKKISDFTGATVTYSSSNSSVVPVSNGTSLKVVKAGNATVTATIKNATLTATKLEGEHTDSNTASLATVKQTVTATFNVHAYATGTVMVLPIDTTVATTGTIPAITTGTYKSGDATMSFNDEQDFAAYTVAANTADGLAAYTVAPATTVADFVSDGVQTKYKLTVAADANTAKFVKVTAAADKNTASDAGTKVGIKPQLDGADVVANKASIKSTKVYTATTEAVGPISAYGSTNVTKNEAGTLDITGLDVSVPTGAILTVAKGAKLGKITGAGNVVVNGGTVASIDVDGTVGVTAAGDTTVGSITANGAITVNGGDANATLGDLASDVSVAVTGDTAKNSSNVYSSVTVGKIAAPTVTLSADEESEAVAEGKVTTGNIVADTKVAITAPAHVADVLTTGTISGVTPFSKYCPYAAELELTAGKFKTGDVKYIGKVTVANGADLTVGAVNTGIQSAGAVANCETGKANSGEGLDVSGKLTATSIYTQKIAGNGTVSVPANSFEIATDKVANLGSNLTLDITNLQVGSVLYKTTSDQTELFTIPGVKTVKATTADNTTTYTAADVEFAGIKMSKSSLVLGKDASDVLTANSIAGVALPKDVTVKWTADKDTVKLTPSADTKSCTVTSVGYTAENVNDGNNVTVTATLVKNGSDYDSVSSYTQDAKVLLTAETAPVLTTKVKNLNDTEAKAVTGDTVIKMTQSTYATVEFSADKAGIANINYITANDKVAQTGTASAWNGTAGTYNVYANGKVGDKVGVFANGVKVFQIEIVDRPFKCDTTLDLDGVKGKALTVGQKYSFKITPADGTKIDSFTFLTANDSAVASWGFVKNADGTVTATIKALKATDKIGVYAKINGVTYKVFAAAVK